MRNREEPIVAARRGFVGGLVIAVMHTTLVAWLYSGILVNRRHQQ